jgi:hypothetical protein
MNFADWASTLNSRTRQAVIKYSGHPVKGVAFFSSAGIKQVEKAKNFITY